MKRAYVANRKGDISIYVGVGSYPCIRVTISSEIPQIPIFQLKAPINGNEDIKVLSQMAITVLVEDLCSYLVAHSIDKVVIDSLVKSIQDSLENLHKNMSDKEEQDHLDSILSRDVYELYETHFEVPEQFILDVHSNLVTASSYRRTDRVKPYKRDIGVTINKMVKNPDPQSVIKKLRNNIYKHTPSKNYIIMYDINGKPTGMLEAPRYPVTFKSKLLK